MMTKTEIRKMVDEPFNSEQATLQSILCAVEGIYELMSKQVEPAQMAMKIEEEDKPVVDKPKRTRKKKEEV